MSFANFGNSDISRKPQILLLLGAHVTRGERAWQTTKTVLRWAS